LGVETAYCDCLGNYRGPDCGIYVKQSKVGEVNRYNFTESAKTKIPQAYFISVDLEDFNIAALNVSLHHGIYRVYAKYSERGQRLTDK